MSANEQNPQGPVIIRRLTTAGTDSAFWPECYALCTQLVEPGWASYLTAIVGHIAQMGLRALAADGAGKSPADVPLHEWNAGAFLTMYQKSASMPTNPNVAPPGIKGLTVLDETSIIEDGRIGFMVTAYQPRDEDYMEGGTRLPATEIERITQTVGRFKVLLQSGPDQQIVWADGIFVEEEACREIVQKIKDTAV